MLVAALPLYQSTELVRGLVLGDLGPHVLIATGYLLVMGVAGSWLAGRRFSAALLR